MRRVLITGATGVLGSALVPLFANEPETEIWLVIRAESDTHLAQRLDKLFAYWDEDLRHPTARDRIHALRGDVSAPGLGLTVADYDRLTRSLTHIVHCAASVKLTMSEAEAERSSVEPVRRVLALIADCERRGRAPKLDYVSTLGVAGRLQGLVPEAPLDGGQGFHNTYESSKFEAERLVLAAIDAGLEATVHRPSMVVGDSRNGKIIRFQGFYFLCGFLAGGQTLGIVPRLDEVRLDFVPSDFVAAAIHWASASERATGRILHLCSGPERAPTLWQLMQRLNALARAREPGMPPLRPVPMGLFRLFLKGLGLVAFGGLRRRLGNLKLFLDYADDRQDFASRETLALLAGAGILLPEPADTLPRLMAYQVRARAAKVAPVASKASPPSNLPPTRGEASKNNALSHALTSPRRA